MQMGLQQEETEPESYNEFLEAIGNQFRRAKPRNWLGVEVVESVFLRFPCLTSH
jgi:hypothetical protein